MCHKLSENIIFMCSRFIEIDEKDVIRFRYGMEVFLESIWKIIGLLIIGLCSSRTLSFYISILCFMGLRLNAGGKHLQHSISCFLFMTATGVISVLFAEYSDIHMFLSCLLYVWMLVVCYRFAPCLSTELDYKQMIKKRNLACLTVIIYFIIFTIYASKTIGCVFLYAPIIETITIIPWKGEK